MQFEVFTLLPEIFPPYLGTSILERAIQRGLIQVHVHNIRDYTHDKHHTTDDTPYGGGGGMVMKPEPVFEAVESVIGRGAGIPVILLSPQGRVFNQKTAEQLSKIEKIAILCGRYEGVDERIRQYLATDEISIGDYVLTGGELPALILIDTIARLIPGALGDPTGAEDDSHSMGLLEYPQYTRPPSYRDWAVPEILLSGDHEKIDLWRHEQALSRTLNKRPDMLDKAELSEMDRSFMEEARRNSKSR